MGSRVPDETLQAIRERLSIVEVVSAYVSLKKSGRNHLGLCPFHSEKTPSFTVNDERGLFHCFGCGAGGTVFTFVMRADRVEFREAVELLARRAGVVLPKSTEPGPGGEQRQALIDVNETAQSYFVAALRSASGAAAREYLKKRGVSDATVERYGLGCCPRGGAGLARMLSTRRGAANMAAALGLIGRRGDGGVYDRFWGRVTFPIRDTAGRIIGFGGRTLGSEHPKYLNSPESVLFHKGEVLYGLYEARQAIRDAERVVIVEGYLDALALVEAGIGYTVASLGTALGAAQVRLARRYAQEVVAFFDGDRAGQEAAARAFAVCAETGIWGLGAFLPNGFDPDTFVRAHGAAATLSLLQHAVPLADFFIQRIDPGSTASVPQRARAAERIGQVLATVRDPAQYSLLVRKAAQQLGVGEEVFRKDRTKGHSRAVPQTASESATSAAVPESFRPEEMTLLEALALDREVARLVAQRGVLERFENQTLAQAGRMLIAALEHSGQVDAVIDRLPARVAERITAALLGQGAVATGNRSQIARECLERVENRHRDAEARAVRDQLRRAEASGDDAGSLEGLQRAHQQILQRRNLQPG